MMITVLEIILCNSLPFPKLYLSRLYLFCWSHINYFSLKFRLLNHLYTCIHLRIYLEITQAGIPPFLCRRVPVEIIERWRISDRRGRASGGSVHMRCDGRSHVVPGFFAGRRGTGFTSRARILHIRR